MNNYAFIDSQNVHLAVRAQGWEIEWKRFRIYLKEKYHVEKAFLFIGYVKGNRGLYENLQHAGFICIWKPTLIQKNGIIKGNCDAELVLHAMIQYNNFDQAVIVTGDGDFYCLIDYLAEQNKLLTLLIPNKLHYSALFKIKRFKKYINYINDLRSKIKKAP
jgi:uncharacterized LabA/DUF88 family protein